MPDPTEEELEVERKSHAKRKKDYAPVKCRKCKEEIHQLVNVTVKCPLGWRNLSKAGLEHKEVSIIGAQWDDTQWFCGCDISSPSFGKGWKKERRKQRRKKKGNEGRDTRLSPAGVNWTPGEVPGEPHPDTRKRPADMTPREWKAYKAAWVTRKRQAARLRVRNMLGSARFRERQCELEENDGQNQKTKYGRQILEDSGVVHPREGPGPSEGLLRGEDPPGPRDSS